MAVTLPFMQSYDIIITWQGNAEVKEVIYPIIVLSVTDGKIDGKSQKSEMNRK